MSKFVQKCLSVLCCAMIVVTSFYGTVYAKDYEKYDSSDDESTDTEVTYYMIEGEDFSKLFDFGLEDIDNLYDWVWDFRTYTVIKKYTNTDGDEVYKGYFNTPNLQMLVKNKITSNINDGYTDNAYDVEETQWIVPVGPDTGKDNVITRYGFNIPSYTYTGEYPTEVMSLAGIIPTGFWDTVWRAITSLFGASFIKAPSSQNFNTITYMNHGYKDKEDFLVDFIRLYYIPYFVARVVQDREDEDILGYHEDYFKDVEDFIKNTVTEEENRVAETYITQHVEEYAGIRRAESGYDEWYDKSKSNENTTRWGIPWDVNAFADAKDSDLESYMGIGDNHSGIDIELAHSNKGSGAPYHTTTKDYGSHYNSFEGWILNKENKEYTDALKAWWNADPQRAAYVMESIILNDTSNPFYEEVSTYSGAIQDYFAPCFNDTDLNKEVILIENVFNKSVPVGSYSYRHYYTEEDKEKAPDLPDFVDFPLTADDINSGKATITIRDTEHRSNDDEFTAWHNDEPQKEDYTKEVDDTDAYNEAHKAWEDGGKTGDEPKQEDYKKTVQDYWSWYYAHEEWRGNKPKEKFENDHKVEVNLTNESGVDHFVYKNRNDVDTLISYADIYNFYQVTLPVFEFDEDNWITKKMERQEDDYEKAVDKTNDYDDFIDIINSLSEEKQFHPTGDTMEGIAYSQCLITNQGEDGECKNFDYGAEASITVGSLYAYNGLYHLTPGFSYDEYLEEDGADYFTNDKYNPNDSVYAAYDELTVEQAHKIINFIKNSAGPYYTEVMSNIIKLIILNAADEGDKDPLYITHTDDVRVMPYDVKTLTSADAKNYDAADPRVEIYKKTVIGSFIANFSPQLYVNWGGIFDLITPQKTLLSIIGKITELSVFMQQLCDFDVLDEYGLSPINMWEEKNGFVWLLLGCLTLFFIFNTVKHVVELCRTGSKTGGKVVIGFIVLLVELACLLAIAQNPDRAWTVIKNIENKLINAGEAATFYSDKDLQYLFGDEGDMEVTYYFPYLDAWSKYNTGYGILDDHQEIVYTNPDTGETYPELIDFVNPQMGDNDIGHWSVLLMDSFEYHGKSESAYWSVEYYNEVKDETWYVNGITINNNAYRVVDHFMAPRVTITEKSDDAVKLKTVENENYNGEFQKGMADLLVKLLLALFVCFLSLLKLLIFFWQWYMFYIFFFEAILGRLAEKKTWGQILLQTFAPTAALVLLGAYVGIVLTIGLSAEGFLGVVLIILLFLLTFFMIGWWYRVGNGQYFPGTLKPIYALYTMVSHATMPTTRRFDRKAEQNLEHDLETTFKNEDDEFKAAFRGGSTVQQKRQALFNDDGTVKSSTYNKPIYERLKGDLIDHYERSKHNEYDGRLTEEDRIFMEQFKESIGEEEYIRLHEEYNHRYKPRHPIHLSSSKLKEGTGKNETGTKEQANSKPEAVSKEQSTPKNNKK